MKHSEFFNLKSGTTVKMNQDSINAGTKIVLLDSIDDYYGVTHRIGVRQDGNKIRTTCGNEATLALISHYQVELLESGDQ